MEILPSCSYVSTTIWMHNLDFSTKCLEKKLNRNYTKMLHAILKNLGDSILQNSCCVATYLPSCKPGKISNMCGALLKM